MANGQGIMGFAMQMIRNNPNICNNPQAQEMLRVIETGDVQKGQEIADNICKTYNISRADAIIQAKNFFNLPG